MTDNTPTEPQKKRKANAPESERQDPIGQIIAENIRGFRRRKGWSMEQAAMRLSPFLEQPVSASSLQQWETGIPPRRFTFHELYALCRVYEKPLSLLVVPDVRNPPYPDISGDPYDVIWDFCFEPQAENTRGQDNYRGFWKLLRLMDVETAEAVREPVPQSEDDS